MSGRSDLAGRARREKTAVDFWETLADEAAAESPLWAEALLPEAEREHERVFSPLGEPRHAPGVETIYEGYLVHYGRPRLFAPADADTALLLGDYLYAHGLVRIAAVGDVAAVADLAELISLCAQLRGEHAPGDGIAWAATTSSLGSERLRAARASLGDHGDASTLDRLAREVAGDEAVDAACAAHARRLG